MAIINNIMLINMLIYDNNVDANVNDNDTKLASTYLIRKLIMIKT